MEYTTMAELVRDVVDKSGKSHKEIATRIGISPSSFSQRLTNNSFSGQEVLLIAEVTGNKVAFIPTLPFQQRGIGERVRMMVDGINYDTFASTAVCHSEPCDGWYKELYRDANGRFYVVHYTKWQYAKPFVSPVTRQEAQEFCDKYAGGGVFELLFD